MPSATQFQLLCLLETERTGREVAALFNYETSRPIPFGTLYTDFRRLREKGLLRMRSKRGADSRIRFFCATAAGRRAVRAGRKRYASLATFGT